MTEAGRLLTEHYRTLGHDNPYGVLRTMQIGFNAVAPKKCGGLKYMFLYKIPFYCDHPMCPSCWHIRASKLVDRLLTTSLPSTVRYLQDMEVGQELELQVKKRFMAHSTKYKLVGYIVDFPSYGDLRDAVVEYRLIGAFVVKQDKRSSADEDGREAYFGLNEHQQFRGSIYRSNVTAVGTELAEDFISRLAPPFFSLRPDYAELLQMVEHIKRSSQLGLDMRKRSKN